MRRVQDAASGEAGAITSSRHMRVLHMDGLGHLELGDVINVVLQVGLLVLCVFEAASDIQLLLAFTSPSFQAWKHARQEQGFGWPSSEVTFMYWQVLCLTTVCAVQLLSVLWHVLALFRARHKAIVVPANGTTTEQQREAAAAAVRELQRQREESRRNQGHPVATAMCLNMVFSEWIKVPVLLSLVVRLYDMRAWCNPSDTLFHDNFLAEVFATEPTDSLSTVFQSQDPDQLLSSFPPPSNRRLPTPAAPGTLVDAAPPGLHCLSGSVLDPIKGSLFLACMNCIATLIRYLFRTVRTLDDLWPAAVATLSLGVILLHRPLTASVVMAQVQAAFANTHQLTMNKFTRLSVASLVFGLLSSATILWLCGMSSIHQRLLNMIFGPQPAPRTQAGLAEQERRQLTEEIERLRNQMHVERHRLAQSTAWQGDTVRPMTVIAEEDSRPRPGSRALVDRLSEDRLSVGQPHSHWQDSVQQFSPLVSQTSHRPQPPGHATVTSPAAHPFQAQAEVTTTDQDSASTTTSDRARVMNRSGSTHVMNLYGASWGLKVPRQGTGDTMTLSPHLSKRDSEASTPRAWPGAARSVNSFLRKRPSRPHEPEAAGKLQAAAVSLHQDDTQKQTASAWSPQALVGHMLPRIRTSIGGSSSSPQLPQTTPTTSDNTAQGDSSCVPPPPSPPMPPQPAPPHPPSYRPPTRPPLPGQRFTHAPLPPNGSAHVPELLVSTGRPAASSSFTTSLRGVGQSLSPKKLGGAMMRGTLGAAHKSLDWAAGAVQRAFRHTDRAQSAGHLHSSAITAVTLPHVRTGSESPRSVATGGLPTPGSGSSHTMLSEITAVTDGGGGSGHSQHSTQSTWRGGMTTAARRQAWQPGSPAAGVEGRSRSFLGRKQAVIDSVDEQEAAKEEQRAQYEEEMANLAVQAAEISKNKAKAAQHVRAGLAKVLCVLMLICAVISMALAAANAGAINNDLGWTSGWIWSDITAAVFQLLAAGALTYTVMISNMLVDTASVGDPRVVPM